MLKDRTPVRSSYGEVRSPDLQRVMQYPAGQGKYLAKLLLGCRDHAAGVVKQDDTRRGGVLVKCTNVAYGCTAQRICLGA
jgi:hypothetical protein